MKVKKSSPSQLNLTPFVSQCSQYPLQCYSFITDNCRVNLGDSTQEFFSSHLGTLKTRKDIKTKAEKAVFLDKVS